MTASLAPVTAAISLKSALLFGDGHGDGSTGDGDARNTLSTTNAIERVQLMTNVQIEEAAARER